jgi:hypothetical protein
MLNPVSSCGPFSVLGVLSSLLLVPQIQQQYGDKQLPGFHVTFLGRLLAFGDDIAILVGCVTF